MEYEIQTTNLGKSYDNHWAVKDISIRVPKGQIYGLLGRNGAGKTTIMKMLLGLIRKTHGSIVLFGKEIEGYQKEIFARIGSTIESPGFYPNLTATENLSVFLRLRGKIDYNKIQNALSVVGLPYRDKKQFSKYSLGMKQRLAIANAILNNPDILILDEPANGLDPIGIAEMRTLLKSLSRELGKTILISSHQLAEMEQLTDWIGIIHEGRLLEECSYAELEKKEQPYIRLRVEQPEQVCKYFKDILHLERFQLTDCSAIEIFDLKYSTLELNRLLFANGFEVSEITMCRNNLEDYFRELTGGIGIA